MQKCVMCVFAVVLIIFVALMSASYSVLSPLEAGVKMNTLSQSIDDKFYAQGRHYIGPLHKFIKYPTTLQIIEFSNRFEASARVLRVPSAGGQQMVIECAFQYRLMTARLSSLYQQYEQKYKGKYISVAEAAIKNAAVEFTPTQFFTNRIQIGEVFHTKINLKFRKDFFAVVEHFQLMKIVPPTGVNRVNREKIVAKETSLLAVEKKRAIEVRAKSETIRAEYSKNQSIINSQATFKASKITEKANADAIRIVLNAKATAYKNLKTSLNFNNKDFLNFLYIENIRNSKSPDKIVSNLDSAFFTSSL